MLCFGLLFKLIVFVMVVGVEILIVCLMRLFGLVFMIFEFDLVCGMIIFLMSFVGEFLVVILGFEILKYFNWLFIRLMVI